jgi:hypothetical protein
VSEDVDVSVLNGFGADRAAAKRWLKMWDQLGWRILRMPEWLQNIVLEDVKTAVENRVATVEIILKARENKR